MAKRMSVPNLWFQNLTLFHKIHSVYPQKDKLANGLMDLNSGLIIVSIFYMQQPGETENTGSDSSK